MTTNWFCTKCGYSSGAMAYTIYDGRMLCKDCFEKLQGVTVFYLADERPKR